LPSNFPWANPKLNCDKNTRIRIFFIFFILAKIV
jgi:hypothetical protein